jgi:hypothetical protein
MRNINGTTTTKGSTAALFSAIRPILLGCQLEQKKAPKACSAMSFVLFTLDFK